MTHPRLVFLGLFACSMAMPVVSAQDAAETAPKRNFTLPAMQGNDLPRSSLRPNVVLPSFRALWCTPCLEKMPDLNKLHERHSEEDIIVVGYSIDRESKGPEAKHFVEDLGITCPGVYGDPSAMNALLSMEPDEPIVLSTTRLISPEGDVAEVYAGTVFTDWIRRKSRRMLRRYQRRSGA